jgi:hypothetical protein
MPDASRVCARPREPGFPPAYARLPAPAKGAAGNYARVPEDGLRAGKHRASRVHVCARASGVGSRVRRRAGAREGCRAQYAHMHPREDFSDQYARDTRARRSESHGKS